MNTNNYGGTASPMWEVTESGMTLRDYFAARAMQGLLANPGSPIQVNHRSGRGWCNCIVDDVTEFAWVIADAMLKARETSND